jgi:hypothetical protein
MSKSGNLDLTNAAALATSGVAREVPLATVYLFP